MTNKKIKKLFGLVLEVPVAMVVLFLSCVRMWILWTENFFRRVQVLFESRLFVFAENPLEVRFNKESPQKPEAIPGEFSSPGELYIFLAGADDLFSRALREILEGVLGGVAFDRAEDWSPYAADIPSKQQDIERIKNVIDSAKHVDSQPLVLLRCSGIIEVASLQMKVKKAKEKWKQRNLTI